MPLISDVINKEIEDMEKENKKKILLDRLTFTRGPLSGETAHLLFVNQAEAVKELTRKLMIAESREMSRIIFVVGDKGSGKTSLSRIILMQLAKQHRVPLVINLAPELNIDRIWGYVIGCLACNLVIICDEKSREETHNFHKLLQSIGNKELINIGAKEWIEIIQKFKPLNDRIGDKKTPKELFESILCELKREDYFPRILIDEFNPDNTTHKLFFKELNEIIKNSLNLPPSAFVLSTYPKEFEQLKQEFSVIEDSVYLQKLNETHCKELLRRRLIYFNSNSKNYEKIIKTLSEEDVDYKTEFEKYNFQENAVEVIAKYSQGNPLKFIELCETAYDLALKNTTKVTSKEAEEAIKKDENTTRDLIKLTETEKRTLLLINELGGSSHSADLIEKLGVSPSRVSQVLSSLVNKGLITRVKENKNVIFEVQEEKKNDKK
jgi:Cdc6-like AAA superfamily ATPase